MKIWIPKEELQRNGIELTSDGVLISLEKYYRSEVLAMLRKIIRVVSTPLQWERANASDDSS